MKEKITKSDLVDEIVKASSCNRKQVSVVADLFLSAIKKSLENGHTIELRGFGTFEPRLRTGRISARNPKTGEILAEPVAPHYVATFRAGKELHNNLMNLKIDEDDKAK